MSGWTLADKTKLFYCVWLGLVIGVAIGWPVPWLAEVLKVVVLVAVVLISVWAVIMLMPEDKSKSG